MPCLAESSLFRERMPEQISHSLLAVHHDVSVNRASGAGMWLGSAQEQVAFWGVEALGWPGARREHTGSIRPR